MLASLTLLLVCQLVGETLVALFALPVPGPVLGMVLLFLGLLVRRQVTQNGVPEALQTASTGLLSHLSLLFVPAGVGVMLHLALIEDAWFALSTALVASTLIAIAVSALVMLGVERLTRRPAEGDGS